MADDWDLALSDGRSFSELGEDEVNQLGSIVSERLRSLNWLCGHDEDWDLVTGDTIVSWLWDEAWGERPPKKKKSIKERLMVPIERWKHGKG